MLVILRSHKIVAALIIIGIRKDLNIIPTEPATILSKKMRIPVRNILLERGEVEPKYYLSERGNRRY